MLAIIVTMFIAIEHLGIMALEIFGNPAQQAKAFDLPLKFTQQHCDGCCIIWCAYCNQENYSNSIFTSIDCFFTYIS